MTLIARRFLVPVSARNIWHNDPLFVYKIRTKQKCIADYESILLLTQTRLVGFILQWLINYSFLSSYSKNLEAFPIKRNEAYKMPSKIKKKWGKKSENRGEERKLHVKVKVKTGVSLLNLEVLLSVHAQTLEAKIFHLDQKAMKCTTCKWLYEKF